MEWREPPISNHLSLISYLSLPHYIPHTLLSLQPSRQKPSYPYHPIETTYPALLRECNEYSNHIISWGMTAAGKRRVITYDILYPNSTASVD